MKQVKFFNTGKWAEHKPYMPQFEVKAGDVLNIPDDVSPETAAIAVNAKRAEYVDEPNPEVDEHKAALEKARSRPGCHLVFEILVQLCHYDVSHRLPPKGLVFSMGARYLPRGGPIGLSYFKVGPSSQLRRLRPREQS